MSFLPAYCQVLPDSRSGNIKVEDLMPQMPNSGATATVLPLRQAESHLGSPSRALKGVEPEDSGGRRA